MAERINRTLNKTVHSMLSDSKLLKRFLIDHEALSTATYLHSHGPTTAVQEKTPFEAWTKVKSDVGHLKAFSCLCYVYVAKNE